MLSSEPGGWDAALLRANWYRECARLVRRYGYHGKWRNSPWGRFGDFWKKHRDSRSLVAEPALFEVLSRETFWGPGKMSLRGSARKVRAR